MKLEEIQRCALELTDSGRAQPVTELLYSLPAVRVEDDGGIAEAQRRSRELEEDPAVGCSWEELKLAVGR